jgi:hypothetical protein|tara:strand:- start:759 stop:1112 length:354 start_codon:yes stop_codon:yes gene_type:complete
MVKLVAVLRVNATDAHAASAVTVTVNPPSIVTVSPATGTEKPLAPPMESDQVSGEFQLPDATETRAAALAGDAAMRQMAETTALRSNARTGCRRCCTMLSLARPLPEQSAARRPVTA